MSVWGEGGLVEQRTCPGRRRPETPGAGKVEEGAMQGASGQWTGDVGWAPTGTGSPWVPHSGPHLQATEQGS